ncbi:protein of unknown function DUF214 [Fibrella aestuarina BUZ 2]|uniref:Macrolide export ATP-binding/permease protein macB n=1 Tax=Fibrella aestuarina BUZ 2 TaxID=1166018 RepID=I0K280_9BACT|nr:ABC transporter permease [Fibrella aestuarina]CCG98233.1 protein of unknown function DUF214 [Fibrella aestuarina BUZ 2]
MLRNYINIARRNLQRNKSYTIINLVGLGLGMACAIVAFAVVGYHLNFDTFHTDSDRIYRVVTESHREDISYVGAVPGPLGERFRADYDLAERVARAAQFEEQIMAVKRQNELLKFTEAAGIACVDPDFFAIFNFPMRVGNARTALAEPNTVLITEEVARRYFGTTTPLPDVLGKTIRWNNDLDLRVAGVLANVPNQTDLPQQLYTAFSTLKGAKDPLMQWLSSNDSWGGIYSGMQCFIKLRPGVSAASVDRVFPAFVKKYDKPTPERFNKYLLQPLADMHFDARFGGKVEKKYLLTLGLIGLVLVVTACLNFINLATAQALKRAKEVGVRKVLGGHKSQLLNQFMAETALLVLIATVLAYGLANTALPFINEWFQTHISLDLFQNGPLLGFLVVLSGLVVLLAGGYPGLVLAGFQPITALRGKINQRQIGGFPLRRVLVVGQFVIAQALVICTLVITSQMRYAKQADLGFTKDAVVLLPVPEASKANIATLRNQLAQLPAVTTMSFCAAAPASEFNQSTSFRYDTRTSREAFNINLKHVDEQYLETFGLTLVAGRNLMPSDTVREYLINQTTARKLGLRTPEEAIGKTIQVNEKPGTIVGIVKDFHNLSFHEVIEPLCLTTSLPDYNLCALKINLSNVPGTLAALERTWNGIFPAFPYSYQFLDDHIGRFYQLEEQMLRLILAFAAIALLIGCLGLYGLVTFVVAQRTKEIGVRKVLGASVGNVIWQLDRQFIALVLVAFAVAAPLAGWAMHTWLQGFIYHIDLNVGVFALAVGGTLLLTLLVVGYQSVRAALMNPVTSLKTE